MVHGLSLLKVIDAYVRFSAQSLPQFTASNDFSWDVSMLYT